MGVTGVVKELAFDQHLVDKLRASIIKEIIQTEQVYNMLNAGLITMTEYLAITQGL